MAVSGIATGHIYITIMITDYIPRPTMNYKWINILERGDVLDIVCGIFCDILPIFKHV